VASLPSFYGDGLIVLVNNGEIIGAFDSIEEFLEAVKNGEIQFNVTGG